VQVGQAAPEFERFVTRLVPEEQAGVRPLGILSESEKHGLIAEATALLLPSRTDSFGIVLLEAWAHGKPVIGANAGGIPGVIDPGQNGILVEFGDVSAIGKAVASLLANPEQRDQMGQNGREKVRTNYTWKQVGSRVLHNYNMTQNA
jgi:glycosyltransferase involved in cell wall biosynthesis